MKKKKNFFIILSCVVACCILLGVFFSPQYKIFKYENNDSTKNLIDVCNRLALFKDDEYKHYADILLDRKDFKEVYKKRLTGMTWETYNDLIICNIFECYARSNDNEALGDGITKYFPKLKMCEPVFVLAWSLGEYTDYANNNKNTILNSLIELYNSSTVEQEKRVYLETIVAYFQYLGSNSKKASFYAGEFQKSVDGMKDYEYRFSLSGIAFSKACWYSMLTGEYRNEILDYADMILFGRRISRFIKPNFVGKLDVSKSDVVEFYDTNCDLLNASVQEFLSNANGERVNLFFMDGVDRNLFEKSDLKKGVIVNGSEVAIWEPDTKTNLLPQIDVYQNCVESLCLMDSFMLEHGYIQKNDDYTISISGNVKLETEESTDGASTPNVIEFKLYGISTGNDFSLVYCETELAGSYNKIDENWYLKSN